MHRLNLFEDSTARQGQIRLSVVSHVAHCVFIGGLEPTDQIAKVKLQLTGHWQDLRC